MLLCTCQDWQVWCLQFGSAAQDERTHHRKAKLYSVFLSTKTQTIDTSCIIYFVQEVTPLDVVPVLVSTCAVKSSVELPLDFEEGLVFLLPVECKEATVTPFLTGESTFPTLIFKNASSNVVLTNAQSVMCSSSLCVSISAKIVDKGIFLAGNELMLSSVCHAVLGTWKLLVPAR